MECLTLLAVGSALKYIALCCSSAFDFPPPLLATLSTSMHPSRLSQLGSLVWKGAAKSGEALKAGAIKGGQLACQGALKSKQFVQAHPKVAKTAAIVGGAAVGVAVAPAVLAAAGFGAAVQSSVYGAWTTGVFSVLQSAGAAGIGATGTAVAAASGATVVGAAVATTL